MGRFSGPNCLQTNRNLQNTSEQNGPGWYFLYLDFKSTELDLMISRHDAVEKVKGKLQRSNRFRTKCTVTKAKLEYEDVEQM